MTNKRCFFLLIFAVAVLVQAPASGAGQPSIIKFVMPIASGLSMGSTGQIVKDIGKALERRVGIKVDSKELRYDRDVDVAKKLFDLLKKEDIDISIISPRDYFGLQTMKKDLVVPFGTITFFNKPTITACVYTRKSDNLKTLAQLKGKRWGGAATIPTRYLLYKNGINESPKKLYPMTYISDENVTSMLDALHGNKIDFFVLGSFQVNMAKGADKKFNEIDESNCFEYDHSWLVVYRKGLPVDLTDKIQSIFLNAHKDKEFAQFKFLFAAIQGHFVKYDPAKMKTAQEVHNLVVKNKWDEEERAFIKSGLKKK